MLKEGVQIFVTHFVTCPIQESFHRHFREGTWSKYLPEEPIMLYYTEDPEKYIRNIMEEVGFKVEVCEYEKNKGTAKNYTVPRNDAILYLSRYAHLLKWRNNEENILDVGCGDGSVTKEVLYPYIEKHAKQIEAVDLSEAMIEYAKANYNMDKIHFKTMDLGSHEDVKTLTTKFDHIFSFYCIHWILDQKSLMERFYNILNPGGQIFITTLADTSIHNTFNKHLKEGTWSKYLPNTSGFTDYSDDPAKFMRDLLEKTGFSVELCITEKKTGPFDDFKGFIRSLISVHPFIDYIPKELQEDYIQDHIKNSCEFSIRLDESGKYSWPYQPLVFVATKK